LAFVFVLPRRRPQPGATWRWSGSGRRRILADGVGLGQAAAPISAAGTASRVHGDRRRLACHVGPGPREWQRHGGRSGRGWRSSAATCCMLFPLHAYLAFVSSDMASRVVARLDHLVFSACGDEQLTGPFCHCASWFALLHLMLSLLLCRPTGLLQVSPGGSAAKRDVKVSPLRPPTAATPLKPGRRRFAGDGRRGGGGGAGLGGDGDGKSVNVNAAGKQRRHVCDLCKMSYFHKGDLNRHVRMVRCVGNGWCLCCISGEASALARQWRRIHLSWELCLGLYAYRSLVLLYGIDVRLVWAWHLTCCVPFFWLLLLCSLIDCGCGRCMKGIVRTPVQCALLHCTFIRAAFFFV